MSHSSADDAIVLPYIVPYPRWSGKSLLDLDKDQIVQILRAMQRQGELTKRAAYWVYCQLLEDGSPLMRTYFETAKNLIRDHRTWRDFVEQPIFSQLEDEARKRGFVWDIGVQLDDEIDLSSRGPLERQIVGAIRDCINAHGPITRDGAHSAAKRVIGAIKTYNRKVKRP